MTKTLVQFEITPVIPVAQYANIQPVIIGSGETMAEAQEDAFRQMEDIWARYGEKPLKGRALNASEELSLVETFTGEKIRWYADRHEYTDLEGNHLVSGSEYAKSFEKPFDTAMLSGKVGTKYNVAPELVAEAWKHNSKVSTTFGNALHLAMEQWFKYRNVACGDKEYNLAKPTFLREAVNTFPLKDAYVIPEVIVSNVAAKMAGTIDAIHLTDNNNTNTCDILDYKSDTDVEKNLPKHFRQLSYYAKILQLAGWSVGKLVVWNYTDGKWTAHESEVMEVTL